MVVDAVSVRRSLLMAVMVIGTWTGASVGVVSPSVGWRMVSDGVAAVGTGDTHQNC